MDERYSKNLWGRCLTCGFLAKHAHPGFRQMPTPTFYEIEDHDRMLGAAFTHVPDVFVGEIPTEPACFRQVIRFYDAMGPGLRSGLDRTEAARQVFSEDRHCPKWYPYTPGLSPKEHLDEFRILELEQRREELDQKLEQDRRAFEERMEKERRGFEEGLSDRAEQSEGQRHRLVLWIAGAAVILALAEVGAAILGTGPDSVFGKLLGLD